MEIHAVLVSLRDVPEGQKVTKRTGAKEYTVRDQVRFFGAGIDPVVASGGVRFLNDESRGTFNAHPGEMQVFWKVSARELRRHLAQIDAERNAK